MKIETALVGGGIQHHGNDSVLHLTHKIHLRITFIFHGGEKSLITFEYLCGHLIFFF